MLTDLYVWSLIGWLLSPLLVYAAIQILQWFVVDLTIESGQHKSQMAQYIAENAFRSPRKSGVLNLPAPGLHIMWGAIVMMSITSSGTSAYRVFTWGKTAKELISKFNGRKNGVTVLYAEQPSAYSSVTEESVRFDLTPVEWQCELLEIVGQQYAKTQNATVLISGAAGTGKSTMGMFLSGLLKKQYHCVPQVLIFDPTLPGMKCGDVVGYASVLNPTIIMINEYDRVVKHAEESKSVKPMEAALMQNRTSATQTLDRLAMTEHVIVVFTTNEPIDMIPSAYTRAPRAMIHYTVKSKEQVYKK